MRTSLAMLKVAFLSCFSAVAAQSHDGEETCTSVPEPYHGNALMQTKSKEMWKSHTSHNTAPARYAGAAGGQVSKHQPHGNALMQTQHKEMLKSHMTHKEALVAAPEGVKMEWYGDNMCAGDIRYYYWLVDGGNDMSACTTWKTADPNLKAKEIYFKSVCEGGIATKELYFVDNECKKEVEFDDADQGVSGQLGFSMTIDAANFAKQKRGECFAFVYTAKATVEAITESEVKRETESGSDNKIHYAKLVGYEKVTFPDCGATKSGEATESGEADTTKEATESGEKSKSHRHAFFVGEFVLGDDYKNLHEFVDALKENIA